MTEGSTSKWNSFPMGPALRHYLGIAPNAYKGETAPQPNAATVSDFEIFLDEYLKSHPIQNISELSDIAEEMVGMGLGQSSLTAIALNDMPDHKSDFRLLLAQGCAHMLVSQIEEAIEVLGEAHAVKADEPAPCINLAKIFYSMNEDSSAQQWAEAGLALDPNNQQLWEICGRIACAENMEAAGNQIRELGEKFDSYSGLSLAAELIDPNDSLLKAQMMEKVYTSGDRSPEFLIEYTAALGMAGQYDKVTSVIWQAEKLDGQNIPWQLYAHGAQANLAKENGEVASEMIAKIEKYPDAPSDLIRDLKSVYDSDIVQQPQT